MRSNNYFSRRWQGQVPVATLFWRDMLGVGTLINLTATSLALVAIINDIHAGFALALHLSPLPFNIFLLVTLNRAPDRNTLMMAIAVAWFVGMMLV
jgi:hypothetical protein